VGQLREFLFLFLLLFFFSSLATCFLQFSNLFCCRTVNFRLCPFTWMETRIILCSWNISKALERQFWNSGDDPLLLLFSFVSDEILSHLCFFFLFFSLFSFFPPSQAGVRLIWASLKRSSLLITSSIRATASVMEQAILDSIVMFVSAPPFHFLSFSFLFFFFHDDCWFSLNVGCCFGFVLVINECVSSPCMNGGTCVDGLEAYTCVCSAGYSDTNCQQKEGSGFFDLLTLGSASISSSGSAPVLISAVGETGSLYYPSPFVFYENQALLDFRVYFTFSIVCPGGTSSCANGMSLIVRFMLFSSSFFHFFFFFFFFF